MSSVSFVEKLYGAISDPRNLSIVSWHIEGGFVIGDMEQFEKKTLLEYKLAKDWRNFKALMTKFRIKCIDGNHYKQDDNLLNAGRIDLVNELAEKYRIKRVRVEPTPSCDIFHLNDCSSCISLQKELEEVRLLNKRQAFEITTLRETLQKVNSQHNLPMTHLIKR